MSSEIIKRELSRERDIEWDMSTEISQVMHWYKLKEISTEVCWERYVDRDSHRSR
jgi:hypothetical protein